MWEAEPLGCFIHGPFVRVIDLSIAQQSRNRQVRITYLPYINDLAGFYLHLFRDGLSKVTQTVTHWYLNL